MKIETVISKRRLLLLLALLSAFPPLSTAMYLPAIPLLVIQWRQPLTVVNLTLVAFFVSYCMSLLVFGPLSDRFGRRKPLLWGIGLYVLSSMLCALSNQAVAMIIFRIFQGAGAASASALALAISKDVYEGHERARILAHISVILALAPMLAPVFGGWIMIWLSWRWIFITQGTIGAIAWAYVLRMPETLQTTSASGFLQTIGIYFKLLRNRRYFGFALMMSLVALPVFTFVGGSADIYINRLGLSEQAFGYFFGFNAFSIMAGSFTCSRLLNRMGPAKLMTAGFAGIMLGGFAMLMRQLPPPWEFAIPMAVMSFSFGLSRPPGNNFVLEQVNRYAGAASSLLVFIYFMLGAVAMWLISFDWSDKIRLIGLLGAVGGSLLLGIWLCLPQTLTRFAQRTPPR